MSWGEWLTSPADLPLWIRIVQAFSLTALAIFGGFITYSQYHVQREKLRWDLYEKRWEVFELTLKFCGLVMKNMNPEHADYRVSWEARNRAQFLFGRDVNQTLERLHKIATGLHATAAMIEGPHGQQRDNAIERNHQLSTEFHELSENIHTVFSRYLKFEHGSA